MLLFVACLGVMFNAQPQFEGHVSKPSCATAGSNGSQKAWETGPGGSFKGPVPEAPVDVMTYDDSSSGQVAPVSAESALAAFNDACGDSFQRREDVDHPARHISKSGKKSPVLLQLCETDCSISLHADSSCRLLQGSCHCGVNVA